MSRLTSFIQDFTKQKTYPPSYTNSFFNLPAAPEYSMGEVSLAALYRALGSKVEEKEVYAINSLASSRVRKELERKWINFKNTHKLENSNVLDYLKSPLAGKSPRNPKEYLNLYPLIPQFSYVSNSARFTGNPWKPAEFIKGMISTGSQTIEEAEEKWNLLFDAISVTSEDDLWANLLNEVFSFNGNDEDEFKWTRQTYNRDVYKSFMLVDPSIFVKYSIPAKTFCDKLSFLKSLKTVSTRRQWISMFESFLRISMGAHLLWICHINNRLWQLVNQALEGSKIQDYLSMENFLFTGFESLKLDENSDNIFKMSCGAYAESRIGLNLVQLYFNEKYGVELPKSFSDMGALFKWILDINSISIKNNEKQNIKNELLALLSKYPRIQYADSSFSRNLFFFLKHSMGQKKTAEAKERNFDQSYWVIKSGRAQNAPWVSKLGPVSVIVLVTLSLANKKHGTATDITDFLKSLGIITNPDKILNSTLGSSLIDLGLTNDSPDGEKGVIILNPFYQA